MDQGDLIPHLFRNEYTKIVAVLAKRFGLDHIEIAEDLASETFLTATQTWGIEGIPSNPVAWLHRVAQNKGINYLKREAKFKHKIIGDLKYQEPAFLDPFIDLSDKNISDSQLHMMFVICHPSISKEAQISLSLRILCGFGIDEIAAAFLVQKDTINKRLFRAKEKLREENILIEMPDATQIESRLTTVLSTIYLLFNEGYYSVSQDTPLRKELCLEAIRLCTLLIEHEPTNLPVVHALMALMCFHTSRFDARTNKQGEMVLYEDQDTSLWNIKWIQKGIYFLKQSSQGEKISTYHLEAGIAYWHTQKTDDPAKWDAILQLYNQLLQLDYSPIAALNRTYALSRSARPDAKTQAINEALKLNLADNQFYFVLLGELYTGLDAEIAKSNFIQALGLARTFADKQAILKKIEQL